MIKDNINNLSRAITQTKLVRFSVIINLIIFLPGLILCVIIAILYGPHGYSIRDNYISDLGSLNFTPVPLLFDSILMSGAILILPAFFYNSKYLTSGARKIIFNREEKLSRRILYIFIYVNAIIGLIFLLIGSIGMFGIGIFSEDRIIELHFIFSVLVFVGLIFGSLFVGIAIVLRKAICPRFLGFYMIIGPYLAGYLFLNPPFMAPKPFLEWVMLFSFQIWLIPAAFFTLNHIKKNQ
jgi:hypothetical membrane protein